MYLSENESFLEAMGYDEDDAGVDVDMPTWAPDELSFRRYLELDAKHALANVARLASEGYGRHEVVITNGRNPGYGYGAIAVIVGGPDAGDCLHSLSAFGRAHRALSKDQREVSVPAAVGGMRPAA